MFYDISVFIFASTVYSFGVLFFISQNKISPGGFTGIATIIDSVFGVPTGLTFLILNIPVLILGYLKIGTKFILSTAAVTLIISVIMQIMEPIIKNGKIDTLLAAVFGGILTGLGIGIILLKGATTGGVDILAKLINSRYPHITIGRIILIFDFSVIILTAITYKNIESSLYSLITIFVSARVTDTIVYGNDKGKIAFIISKNSESISDDILFKLNRGTTKINITGGYSKKESEMIMCTVRPHEISTLYSIIQANDMNAFTILSSADEILGFGFKKF